MKAYFFIFIGGGLGSLLRYGVSELLKKSFLTTPFPWGTFAVNIVGSLLIGFLTTLALKNMVDPNLRLFAIVGLCGGFTTFSTFSNEAVALLRDGYYLYFSLYVLGSISLALLAVIIGSFIAHQLD